MAVPQYLQPAADAVYPRKASLEGPGAESTSEDGSLDPVRSVRDSSLTTASSVSLSLPSSSPSMARHDSLSQSLAASGPEQRSRSSTEPAAMLRQKYTGVEIAGAQLDPLGARSPTNQSYKLPLPDIPPETLGYLRRLRVGVYKFNQSPTKGMAYLCRNGFVDETPGAVAQFLLTQPGLSKRCIGEYLGASVAAAASATGLYSWCGWPPAHAQVRSRRSIRAYCRSMFVC